MHQKYFMIILFVVALIIHFAPNSKSFYGVSYANIFLSWAIFYPLIFIPLKTYFTFNSIKQQSVKYEIELLEDGFHYSSEMGRGMLPWSYYTSYAENSRVIILFQGRRPASIIPKHYFTSPELLLEFKNILSKYVYRKS